MVKKKSEVSGLRLSSKRVGKLYPVLLDRDGNVIDGQHRLAADSSWPKIRLEHISSEEERLAARLIGNVCRRTVSAGEKSNILEKLGEIYLARGVRRERLGFVIAEELGMSYRWVMQYLPSHLKCRPGLGGPSRAFDIDKSKDGFYKGKVAMLSTSKKGWLFCVSTERVVSVRSYRNASFVNLLMERHLYDKLEKLSSMVGIAAETVINNAIILALKELEVTTDLRRFLKRGL